MSCPYFDPVQPRADAASSRHAMLPLGDCWTGICHANADNPQSPDESALQACCNLGYARGTCQRFPAGDGPDAVRFTIVRDDGASLRLYYVIECDHRPFAHGSLEFSSAGGEFAPHPQGGLTVRQARAYVESYQRRKLQSA